MYMYVYTYMYIWVYTLHVTVICSSLTNFIKNGGIRELFTKERRKFSRKVDGVVSFITSIDFKRKNKNKITSRVGKMEITPIKTYDIEVWRRLDKGTPYFTIEQVVYTTHFSH